MLAQYQHDARSGDERIEIARQRGPEGVDVEHEQGAELKLRGHRYDVPHGELREPREGNAQLRGERTSRLAHEIHDRTWHPDGQPSLLP